MKRSLLIISLIICALTTAKAQYYSVNYDQETVAKMVASFALSSRRSRCRWYLHQQVP